METRVITSVTAEVDPSRQEEFLEGYRQLSAERKPDGLLRSELLKGQNGRWRIESLWRDRAALMAVRESVWGASTRLGSLQRRIALGNCDMKLPVSICQSGRGENGWTHCRRPGTGLAVKRRRGTHGLVRRSGQLALCRPRS
jgi:hypothetical protein